MARPADSRITIRKATPTHSVRDAAYKAACHPVDVSGLAHILEIDGNQRLAIAEGQVLLGDLARATLAHGLLPAVVPEFRKFTVAGLVNGEGIQSSSHRHGLFSHTVKSLELLQADGSTVSASSGELPDLFAAVFESLGTLGIVTAATIRLVPASRYVKITCRRFTDRDAYLDAFRESLGRPAFHEGVVYGPRMYVLITGDFVDDPSAAARFDPDEPGGRYFYQHVRAAAAARDVSEYIIETLAYLSRSERGMWWLLECHTDFPLLSETAWGRRHMDKAVADVYNRSGLGGTDFPPHDRDRCLIQQDMGVALERLGEGLDWVRQRLGVYPIWNCAVRLPENAPLRSKTAYLVDIGLYGEPTVPGYRHIRDMRALQQMVEAPALWGVSYLSWDEIRAVSPARYECYERARVAHHAGDAFLHLKEKVVWIDPQHRDQGKIPLWRLRRSFGPRWYLNPLVYPLLAVVYLSKLLWRQPSAA
jgi:delta24-sterol reductase